MSRKNLVVIGNGMVGHRFIERTIAQGATEEWNIITFCEESRLAYDRVNLSGFFSGKTAEDLSLVAPDSYQNVQVYLNDKAVEIDREARTVRSPSWSNLERQTDTKYCRRKISPSAVPSRKHDPTRIQL